MNFAYPIILRKPKLLICKADIYMTEEKALPNEIVFAFTALKSELVWLYGRWIIFEQLFGVSSERVDLLNQRASTYFYIT